MTTLIDALKGLRDEMGTYDSAGGNRSPNEFQIGRNSATAYWEDKLSEIIAEHERSGGWLPIGSAPNDEVSMFWVRPRNQNDDHFCDTSGRPILSKGCCPRLHIGKPRTWSALEIATLWQPLPKGPA